MPLDKISSLRSRCSSLRSACSVSTHWLSYFLQKHTSSPQAPIHLLLSSTNFSSISPQHSSRTNPSISSAFSSALCQPSSASLLLPSSSLNLIFNISTSSPKRAISENAISRTAPSSVHPGLIGEVRPLVVCVWGLWDVEVDERMVLETEGMRGTVTSRARAE